MRVHISTGNSKLGRIPNLSLPPVTTCPTGIPCANADCCYAIKSWRQYPATRNAWQENLDYYTHDPGQYFTDIMLWVKRKSPAYFRWHVAGDIPDQAYLDWIKALAEACPRTRWLVYTKRYTLDYSTRPDNLSLVISAWPGMSIVRIGTLPIAWCQDGSETRMPKDAIECKGTAAGVKRITCDHCYKCWDLERRGRDVWFHKH